MKLTKQEYEAYIKDTKEHINLVRETIHIFVGELIKRSVLHDRSKLEEPEKSIFAKNTAERDKHKYGSEGYHQHLEKVRVALEHHYANNSHHPEHYPNGIKDMNLFDIIEMFCDWYAVTQQHNKNSIEESIEINQKRFNYSDDLEAIMKNTVPLIKKILREDTDRAV